MNDDIYNLVNKIFCIDAPLSKDQHIELQSHSRAKNPDVALWLSILESIYNDWMAYSTNPVYENKKLVRDILQWGFKDCFNMDRLSEAVYLAYKIEPDVFKTKFRTWLRTTKPKTKTKRNAFELTEPMESVTIMVETIDHATIQGPSNCKCFS